MFARVPVIFFQNPGNSSQKAFPRLSQTLCYQPRVLELPILLNQVSHKGPMSSSLLTQTFFGWEEDCVTSPKNVCVKARLHRRFLSRQLDAIFVALNLQLQNRTCKPGAIFSAICRRDIAGVSNMFEYRLCKRALRG